MPDINNNVNLEDMMGNKSRARTPISLDVTKPITSIPSNDGTSEPIYSKLTQVNSGPIDKDSIKPLDIDSILPRAKPQASNTLENNLYADLDAAVEREKESITARHNELFEMQKKELEELEEKEEMTKQEAEDKFILADDINRFDDKDLYDYTEAEDCLEDNVETVNNRISAYENEEPSNTATHYLDNDKKKNIKSTKNDSALPADNIEADNNYTTPVYEKKLEEEPIIPKTETVKTINTEDSILDMQDDDSLFEEETDDNTKLEDLKSAVKAKIAPIRKSFDLSKFTIAQKSISAQKVMKLAVQSHQNVADWILYNSNRPISVTGLSGPEILKLNPENSNRNRLNTFRDMYRIIYDHVYDGNKPEFETWLKQTKYVDIQHIYFALYMATFGGSNFINYSCPKCKKVFVQDIKFEDMVSYANDEAKNKVRSILKMDTTSTSDNTYPVDLVQISDNYVFGLHAPSIWNVIIETASLSDKFLETHSDLIDVIAYIDAIYMIDEKNQTLIPIDTKPDPNDQAKTSARRVKAFYDIIRTLSSEAYYTLRVKISDYDKYYDDVTYVIPACKCPNCGADIPENTEITPDNMLFTRHQLAAIGNM